MQKRIKKSVYVNFRSDPAMRAGLDRVAARSQTTISDLLRAAAAALIAANEAEAEEGDHDHV